jgi:Uma2 family endonuclease
MNTHLALKEETVARPPRALNKKKGFTYADYEKWDDDKRWELIDGVAYMMSAPSGIHQGISMELSRIISVFLDDKPCRVYAAPYDVRLFAPLDAAKDDKSDNTVVQPDLVVICDKEKRHREACHGAPDLVVEILSESTRSKDLKLKFNKYLESGVREYWVIDPKKKTLTAYTLEEDDNGRFYETAVYHAEDTLSVGVFNGK